MGDGSVEAPATRNRAGAPAIIYGIAAVILVVPVASAYGEWQHLLGYGWPGPYTYDVGRLNAGETAWKVQFWGVLSGLVLTAAAIGAGFAARAANQRVWLVTLIGLVATVVIVAGVAFLFTPPAASSAG